MGERYRLSHHNLPTRVGMNRDGALRQHKSSGRPSKLTGEVKKKLKRLLDRGALAAGFPTDRWTLVQVSELLKKEFDIDYYPNSLGPVLDQMGHSVQKPLPLAAERDEELVKA